MGRDAVFVFGEDPLPGVFTSLADAAGDMEAIDVENGEYHALYTLDGGVVRMSGASGHVRLCGGGERKTLRLAARYADESNVIARSSDEVARKRDVLRRHCEQIGRDPREVALSLLYIGDALVRGETERFVEEMRPYAALGVDTVVVMPLVEEPVGFVERLGEAVVPALAEL